MNPFAVLGLDESADDAAVRSAYLAAVRAHPPDRDPIEFQRIRAAYDAIRDEERRLELRLFGPPPLDSLEALLDAFPDERWYVGPNAWLAVLRETRP